MTSESLLLEIVTDCDTDLRALEYARIALQRELSSLPDIESSALPLEVPQDSKAASGVEVGQIVLSLLATGGVVTALVSTLREWLVRNQTFRVRIRRGDFELELDSASAKDAVTAEKTLLRLIERSNRKE